MLEKFLRSSQDQQNKNPEFAETPISYNRGDIIWRVAPNGETQLGVITKVKRTNTPIDILTFEILKEYDRRHELTRNYKGTQLRITNTSENLFRIQEAAPKQKGLLSWLKRH